METATIHQPAETAIDRSTYLGSSDIAAVMGLSPWRTAYEVFEGKQEGFVAFEDPDKAKILRRGVRFEPVILDMLQEETGVWITGRNVRHVDHQYPFLACEIDAEATDEQTLNISNVEIKSVSPWAAGDWGAEGTDEIPLYYACQVMFSLMVTGRKYATVAALIGSDDLRVYRINRDEPLIDYIRKAAVDFWTNNVLANVPPTPKSSEDASKVLSRFEGFAWAGNEVVWKQLRTLKGVKEAQKRLESTREGLEIAVKTALANAASDKGVEGDSQKFAILGPDGKPAVTWNSQQTNRIAVKLLRAEHPDIAELFTETTTTRVLRTK
jgi:putative phage-type endonuclease